VNTARRRILKILLAGLILAVGCTPVPTLAAAAPMAQTDGPGWTSGSSPSGIGNNAPSTVPASPGPGDMTDRAPREPSTKVPARAKPDNKAECERAGGKWQPAQQKCDLGA
jgi:hypothetical protein